MVAIICSWEFIIGVIIWVHLCIWSCWSLVLLNHRSDYLTRPIPFSHCLPQNDDFILQLPEILAQIFLVQRYHHHRIRPHVKTYCALWNYSVLFSFFSHFESDQQTFIRQILNDAFSEKDSGEFLIEWIDNGLLFCFLIIAGVKSLVEWKESGMAVVTGFDSEILWAFKVLDVLFVEEVVFGGDLKNFGGDIFDFEFDYLM